MEKAESMQKQTETNKKWYILKTLIKKAFGRNFTIMDLAEK